MRRQSGFGNLQGGGKILGIWATRFGGQFIFHSVNSKTVKFPSKLLKNYKVLISKYFPQYSQQFTGKFPGQMPQLWKILQLESMMASSGGRRKRMGEFNACVTSGRRRRRGTCAVRPSLQSILVLFHCHKRPPYLPPSVLSRSYLAVASCQSGRS